MQAINSTASLSGAIHSYYQAPVSGNSYRYAGVASSLYRDWSSIAGGFLSQTWAFVTMKPGLGASTFTYISDGSIKKKDSGTSIVDWGLNEPSTAYGISLGTAKSQTIDLFESASAWTVNGMGNFSIATTTSTFVEGTSSVLLYNSTATVGANGGSIRKSMATNLSIFSDASLASDLEYIRLWFRCSDITLIKSLEMVFGCGSYDQAFKKKFDTSVDPLASAPDDTFFEVKSAKGAFTPPKDTSKTWSDVTLLRVNMKFNRTLPVGTSIWLDSWSLLGGYNIEGTYKFQYINISKDGAIITAKSNPYSGSSTPLELATARIPISISSLPSSGTKQIYRSFTGDYSQFFLDGEVASGTSSYVSSKKDSDLGEILSTDNDLPPSMIDMAGPHFDRIFGIDSSLRDKTVYSKAKEPDAFPVLNYFLTGTPADPQQRIILFEGIIYIFTVNGIYAVQGTDETSFISYKTRASRGTTAPYSLAMSDRGIYYLSLDGIRFFDGLQSIVLSNEIASVFYGQNWLGITSFDMTLLANARGAYFDNKYFLSYTATGGSQNNQILIYDEITTKWSSWNFSSARSMFVEKVNNYLVLGASNGLAYYASNGLRTIDGPSGTSVMQTTFQSNYGHEGYKVLKDIYIDAECFSIVSVIPIVDGTEKVSTSFAATSGVRLIRRLRTAPHTGKIFEVRIQSASYYRLWDIKSDVLDFVRGGYRKA